ASSARRLIGRRGIVGDYNCRFVSPLRPFQENSTMLKRLALAGASLAMALGALAQDYPTRNVTMIVPYSAGGPTDTVARVLAQAMTKPIGQTVVVENKPSAGGIL